MADFKRLHQEIVEMLQDGSTAAEIAFKLCIPEDWVWQVYDTMDPYVGDEVNGDHETALAEYGVDEDYVFDNDYMDDY